MFIKEVIRALETQGVRYVLVGGCAVALHGAVRGTVDIDLVVPLTKVAFQRTESALGGLGLASRLPVTAAEVFAFRNEYVRNRNLTTWTFVNPDKPLEIVDIIITVDARRVKTATKRAFGMELRIMAIPDLIAMKKASGRAQDIEDIKALEKLA